MSYRYFAFLDLLGYKDLIQIDSKNGTHDLRDRLIASFGALGNVNEADVSIKAISDSIFLTLNNDTLGFQYFATVLRDLQIAFISNGLLLRGGVAFNQHFENGKVTYSPALVDAYQIESTAAFFPRIVIHDAVIEKLKNENTLDPVVQQGLLITHATTYQIHFLTDKNWATLYTSISQLAAQNMLAIQNDPRVFAKHWYLQDYLMHFRPKGLRHKRFLSTWK